MYVTVFKYIAVGRQQVWESFTGLLVLLDALLQHVYGWVLWPHGVRLMDSATSFDIYVANSALCFTFYCTA